MRAGVTNTGAREGVAATLLQPALPLLPAPHAADTSCSRAVSCASRSLTFADRPGLALDAEEIEKGEGAGGSVAMRSGYAGQEAEQCSEGFLRGTRKPEKRPDQANKLLLL